MPPCYDVDADDLFGYKTTRRVIIRDRKLGIMRIVILAVLFVYVVIYEVVLQKGYLVKDEPVGFTTISLRREDWNHTAPDFCCPSQGCGVCLGGAGCTPLEDQASCTAAVGCLWSQRTSLRRFGSELGRLECVGWDRHNILKPPAEEYSALLTTRVTVTRYSPLPRKCVLNATSVSCPPWDEEASQKYYVTGIEGMSVMIDHGVFGKHQNRIVKAQSMDEGWLEGPDGEELLYFCGGDPPGLGVPDMRPCTDEDRSRPGDILQVKDLLRAAGVTSLDAIDLSDKEGHTLRHQGLVLLVVLHYEGTGVDTTLSYRYRVFALHGAEFKYEDTYFQDLPSPPSTPFADQNITRSIWKRHGIRLVFITAGYVASFSFVELMKTLMVFSAMLSVASFLVEHVYIRLLPSAKVYKRYRDLKTVDFSDFDLNKLDDVHFVYGEVRKGGTLEQDPEQEPGEKLGELIKTLEEHRAQGGTGGGAEEMRLMSSDSSPVPSSDSRLPPALAAPQGPDPTPPVTAFRIQTPPPSAPHQTSMEAPQHQLLSERLGVITARPVEDPWWRNGDHVTATAFPPASPAPPPPYNTTVVPSFSQPTPSPYDSQTFSPYYRLHH